MPLPSYIYCLGSLAFLAGTLDGMAATGPSLSSVVYCIGSLAFLVGTLLAARR